MPLAEVEPPLRAASASPPANCAAAPSFSFFRKPLATTRQPDLAYERQRTQPTRRPNRNPHRVLETVQPFHQHRPRQKIRPGGRKPFPRNQKHHRAGAGDDFCRRRGRLAHASEEIHTLIGNAPSLRYLERNERRRSAGHRKPVAQNLHRLALDSRPAQGQAAAEETKSFFGGKK